MTDVIGRGVIEVATDATKLKAGIEDAKRSIKGLGVAQEDVTKAGAASIDRYVQRLQLQATITGKSKRETELLRLAMRGASDAQLLAATSALHLKERQEQLISTQKKISAEAAKQSRERREQAMQFEADLERLGKRSALALTAGLIAAGIAFDQILKKIGDFQDLAEVMGDTAENVASLAVAAGVSGKSMDEISAFSVKLTKNLTGVDDESEKAGAAIAALGLDIKKFKELDPAAQLEAMAKALDSFADGKKKTEVLEALGKGGAQLLPFLKELAGETGRQNILTAEQIRLADEYADKQNKLRAQISLYAGVIAAEMVPSFNDLAGAMLETLKQIGGIETGSRGLSNSTAIQDFAEAGADSLALLVDAGDSVARIFQVIGTNIAAQAAARNSVLRGEFSQAVQIMADLGQQQEKILTRQLFSQKLEEQRAKRKSGGGLTGADFDDADRGAVVRRELKFNGDNKNATQTAKQQAEARLAFDLSEIKKGGELRADAFANAEKLLEARRSANLIEEKEYYAAKLGLINLNTRAQEEALEQEIARLGKEKLSGKEKIDNDRKIAEAQARLTKVRADNAVSVEINSIQEVAANRKIAQSYADAAAAANEYIDSIKRRNAAELDGIGRGEKFRQIQSGRNQIEDKFISERQKLERDRRNGNINDQRFDAYLAKARETYEQEIALYEERTRAILEKEKDWVNGATEALQNYYDESQNIAKQTEELFTNAFKGMEDALVEFVKTGKLDFRSLADSIISDMIRIMIQQQVTGPLAKLLGDGIGSAFGGGAGGGGLEADLAALGIPGFAVGTDFVPRDMLAFVHKGEKITPAAENRAGVGGGGVTVYQTLQFSGATPAAVKEAVFAMMPMIQKQTVAAVQEQRNRTGDSR